LVVITAILLEAEMGKLLADCLFPVNKKVVLHGEADKICELRVIFNKIPFQIHFIFLSIDKSTKPESFVERR
jgi:hypothetical protein